MGIMSGALNLYFIYKFLRILTTPWEKTEAFKLGIINEKGKILKKKARLKTIAEKEAYTMMDRLVWKLKRLMEKIPFGKSRLASYAAALWLIKEEKNFHGNDEELQESVLSFLETDWKNEALILKENYEGDMDKKTYSNLKAGIDIEKSSMKDVIKDFQKSDAPQFKGKSDKKKKEMAIAAKLSKEEFEIDEAKSKLPPHLAKFFDKDGNLKKDAAARVAKGKEKINWIDVTPKGYGPKEETELGEAKRSRKDELKYQAAVAAFKKKGGIIKKDKPGPTFKSFFKGYKHKKGPTQAEEVEATRMPMEAPFVLIDEKWAVGVVYHQDFGGGEISYFRADALLKNKRWKGMGVDEYGGKQKKPRNITADEKTPGWEITPKNEIPKGLKEEVDLEEAVLVNRDYKYDGKKIHISKKNFKKVHKDYKNDTPGKERMITYDSKWGTVSVPVEFTEEVETEASTYTDKARDDEKKKKKHFAFGGKKKSRHGQSGYGKGEEVEVDEAKFSKSMIDKLKKDYEPLRGKRLSLGKNVELEKIVRKIAKDEDALVQLVKADIPFVSMNARLILNKDHGVPLNKYEGVNEASSDTTDMYALMVKGMKAVPGSSKQKDIIKQINVIRKRMGMKLMKEASELEICAPFLHGLSHKGSITYMVRLMSA